MVNRIYIVTLIILFFLSVGRASVRADILMVVNSVMLDSVIKPDEWREVYRWVLADKNVPDRKEVLMLIRYHYGNFGKLTELLFYLNEGKACKYLLQFVFSADRQLYGTFEGVSYCRNTDAGEGTVGNGCRQRRTGFDRVPREKKKAGTIT